MKCPGCQYPLWNLRARACPECGRAFKPSDFEFNISKVRFCCPTCDQPYYGTTREGHLEPSSFDCVKCRTPVTMDEMVLRPGEGVEERQTQPDRLPFEQREGLGRFKRYWKTIGMAMVRPHRLGECLTREGRGWAATRFLIYTQFIAILGSVGIFLLIFPLMMVVGMGAGGGGGPLVMAGVFLVIFAALLVGGLFVALVIAFVWAVMAHLIMSVRGSPAAGLGRTWVALCYAGGSNVVSGVPIVGGYVGPIWWIVSACIAFRGAQKTSTARAVCAGVIPPVAMLFAFVVAYMMFVFAMIGMAGAAGPGGTAPAAVQTQHPATLYNPTALADLMAVWSETTPAPLDDTPPPPWRADGAKFPTHGIVYLIDRTLAPDDVRAPLAESNGRGVVDGLPISTVPALPEDQAIALWERLSAREGGGPHRVGSIVFTYPGITPEIAARPNAGGLWVAVVTDPRGALPMQPQWSWLPTPSDPGIISVATLDPRASHPFDEILFGGQLAEQNALRAEFGLPPLPDPRDIGTDAAP